MEVVSQAGISYSRTSKTTSFMDNSEALILRWSEFPDAPSRETPAEMVNDRNFESVVRVSFKISEATRVSLLGQGYMVNGIVRSCRPEKTSFLVTIVANEDSLYGNFLTSARDPGSLVVDDFLTEEEEAKILEGLQDSAAYSISSAGFVKNRLSPLSRFVSEFARMTRTAFALYAL